MLNVQTHATQPKNKALFFQYTEYRCLLSVIVQNAYKIAKAKHFLNCEFNTTLFTLTFLMTHLYN